MSQHYTGNTVSVQKWCHKCKRKTQHRVDSHVVSNVCLECQTPQPELRPIISAVAEIPAPCTCRKYPFGHYHAIEKFGDSYTRFKPGTWELRA
jgi:hypothetical protein